MFVARDASVVSDQRWSELQSTRRAIVLATELMSEYSATPQVRFPQPLLLWPAFLIFGVL